jgi:hypothetical protein
MGPRLLMMEAGIGNIYVSVVLGQCAIRLGEAIRLVHPLRRYEQRAKRLVEDCADTRYRDAAGGRYLSSEKGQVRTICLDFYMHLKS